MVFYCVRVRLIGVYRHFQQLISNIVTYQN